ncbi:MAG TPA: PEP-CTERM sorting domain-containing protein [Chthoniobacteraceae bacterium]|nr:PEP-CTERM sorting domain-containing protein [Chthoniobacteraceae bacterium]
MKKKHLHLPLGILLLGACTQPLQAGVWIGSQPTKSAWWGTGGNWDNNAGPNNTTNTTQNQAWFLMGTFGAGTNAVTDNVNINNTKDVNDNLIPRKAYYLRVGVGKTVNLNFTGHLELNPGVASVFGTSEYSGNTGTGASTTNFSRTAEGYMDVKLGQFYVGYDLLNGSNGHALNFSGELNVSDTGNVLNSVVGFRGSDNRMTIKEKAKLNLYGLSISSSVSYKGNLVTVADADSSLNVRETLSVGSNAFTPEGATAQEIYDGAARLNGVEVSNGAHVSIKTLGIGRAENARSNYLHIEGEGSEVAVSASTFIGVAGDTSLGGNEVTISGGGELKTAGSIFIAGHRANDGINDGANRLTIAADGTLTAAQDIDVSGLLQLAEGGTLQTEGSGMAVNVKAGGRFEAEGSGLGQLVSASLENGGTLALGVGEGRTSAATLQLDSAIVSDGGILELTAWSGTSIDRIEFLADGSLTGTITLTINPEGFAFSEGDRWTLFTGETDGAISAVFDFSQLGFPVDTSLFNQEGGWQLAVIPEPSTYALIGAGGLLLLAWRRRKG